MLGMWDHDVGNHWGPYSRRFRAEEFQVSSRAFGGGRLSQFCRILDPETQLWLLESESPNVGCLDLLGYEAHAQDPQI